MQGAVHEVRHAQGEGVRGDVTVCDRGRRVKSMWRHIYKFLSYIHVWNLRFKVMFSFLLHVGPNRCILTEGETDKNHPGQNLPDKRPSNKKPREKLRENLYRGLLYWFFVLGLLEMWVRDVQRTFWGSRNVWQSVTVGGGSKLAKNSVTYFMAGP